MQPEQTPSPNYDFIMKNAGTKRRSLLPSGNPVILIGLAVVALLVLVLIFGLIVGGKGSSGTAALTDPIGQAGEISRITTEEQPNLKDPNVISLAATTQTTVTSQQNQMNGYLTSHKVKLDKKQAATYQANDKNVDAALATAVQNNNLDAAYLNYLKSALTNYAASLKTAYASAKDASAKNTLQNAYSSTETLLQSSEFKS